MYMSITTKTSLDDFNEYDFVDVIPTKKQETKVNTVGQDIIASQSSQKKTPPLLSDKNVINNTGHLSPTFSPMSINTANIDKTTIQLESPPSNDNTSCLSQACTWLTNCVTRTLRQDQTHSGKH